MNVSEPSKDFQLGLLMAKNGFQQEAIGYFQKVLAGNPRYVPALINAGVCCRQTNQFVESEIFLTAAKECLNGDNTSPSKRAVLTDLGSLYEDLGRFDEALLLHQQAYDLFPHLPETNINYAYALLREGRWLEAWPKWEWGRSPNAWAYPTQLPRWTGREDLKGKRLLICREGGYGDVFMYLRFTPQIMDLGVEKIGMWAWKNLAGVFDGRNHPVSEFIPSEETAMLSTPDEETQAMFCAWYDYFVPLMSIPACLKATEPPPVPIGSGVPRAWPPKRIGVCWKAEELTVQRKHRSLPDTAAREIVASRPDSEWYSLLPIERLKGTDPYDDGMIWHPLKAWRETAELILQCDLVVSCDTAVAHLAGSLGVPCWWMLPLRRDWKHGRVDRPFIWYPGQRMFAQTDPISWQNVVDEVVEALRQ